MIFVSSAVSSAVIPVAKPLSFLNKIVLLDDGGMNDKKIVNLKDFTSYSVLRDVHFEPRAVNSEKTACFIMCSSGTIGSPKGLKILHKVCRI